METRTTAQFPDQARQAGAQIVQTGPIWTPDQEEHFRAFLQHQCRWADGILAADDVQYPNGRSSHDCAFFTGDVACDWLINRSYLRVDPLLVDEAFNAETVARIPVVHA